MKRFNVRVDSIKQLEDMYEWCRTNIGTENVLWWDAKKQVRGEYGQFAEIWIEEDDQTTLFALTWGHLSSCEA